MVKIGRIVLLKFESLLSKIFCLIFRLMRKKKIVIRLLLIYRRVGFEILNDLILMWILVFSIEV